MNRDLRKAIDQMIVNLDELADCTQYKAMLVRAYYDQLIHEGFTKEQALELCKNFKLFEL